MKNVVKIALESLNPEQIETLEKILDKCVTSIINEYSEEENGALEDFSLSEEVVVNLEKVFTASPLFYMKTVDIAKNTEEVLFNLNWSNSRQMLTVLYPVLFYSLMMKNEINHSAINKRSQRNSSKWGHTKRLLDFPSFLETETKDSFSLLEALKSLDTKCSAKKNQILAEYRKACHFSSTSLSEHVFIACSLGIHYDDILKIEQAAKQGLFLRELLEGFKDPDHVENTILQLYLIDRLDGFFRYLTEMLSDKYTTPAPEGKLLQKYYRNHGYYPEQVLSIVNGASEEKIYGKRDLQIDASYVKETSFHALYKHLADKFSVADAMELLDFYLPRDTLSWYAHFSWRAEEYISAVTTALEKGFTIPENNYSIPRLSIFLDKEE